MSFTLKCIYFLCFSFIGTCSGARILCVFPTPIYGYHVVHRTFVEALATIGHELVVLTTSPFNYDGRDFRVTQIDLGPASYQVARNNLANADLGSYRYKSTLDTLYDTMLDMIDAQLKLPEVKQIITSTSETFDLLLVEAYTPTWLALADKFKVPIVTIFPTHTTLHNFDSMDNPSHPLLHTDVLTTCLKELTFFTRLRLVYKDFKTRQNYYIKYLPKFEKLAKIHFGNHSKSVGLLERNIDVSLININPILLGTRPTVPNLQFLGDVHLPAKFALPDWLEAFVTSSERGFIFVSLGVTVQASMLPPDKIATLVDALAALPFNVVLKWEGGKLEGHPMNVMIHSWFPQFNLLAHPKILAFVTTGGLRSVEEAIVHRVPVVGIPIVGDQFFNIERLVQLGVGIQLNYDTLNKDDILHGIDEVSKNTTYKRKITELSSIIHDAPIRPLDNAVWWIEHTIRHKGAQHFRSPVRGLPWYQLFHLDILIFFLVSFIILLIILRYVVKKAKQKIFGGKASLVMYYDSKKAK